MCHYLRVWSRRLINETNMPHKSLPETLKIIAAVCIRYVIYSFRHVYYNVINDARDSDKEIPYSFV